MAKYTSITTTSATILKQKTSFSRHQSGEVYNVYISNNANALATVDLYLESYADANVKHYTCKSLKIPVGVAVSIPSFPFDIKTFKLMIHANSGGSAPNLTVIT